MSSTTNEPSNTSLDDTKLNTNAEAEPHYGVPLSKEKMIVLQDLVY